MPQGVPPGRHIRSDEVDLSFAIEGKQSVTLRSVTAHAHPDVIYRVFEGGIVLANHSKTERRPRDPSGSVPRTPHTRRLGGGMIENIDNSLTGKALRSVFSVKMRRVLADDRNVPIDIQQQWDIIVPSEAGNEQEVPD